MHDNDIPVEIRHMRFGKNTDDLRNVKNITEEKVIWIHHDFCWGYIDLKTGKYHGRGCD